MARSSRRGDSSRWRDPQGSAVDIVDLQGEDEAVTKITEMQFDPILLRPVDELELTSEVQLPEGRDISQYIGDLCSARVELLRTPQPRQESH